MFISYVCIKVVTFFFSLFFPFHFVATGFSWLIKIFIIYYRGGKHGTPYQTLNRVMNFGYAYPDPVPELLIEMSTETKNAVLILLSRSRTDCPVLTSLL